MIYLHGFASSPQSSKARYFSSKFGEIGREVKTPDLTEGDFEHTTLTQQLAFLSSYVGSQPTVLMGSSMGGYLAPLFAARHPERVSAMILMAPAFGLAERWTHILGAAAMDEWKRVESRPVFHYGENREARISYDLISDGLQYEEFPNVECPTLIFHGKNDESVDYRLSERFAADRPNVQLVLYDSDHQLLDVLDDMWDRATKFLRLNA